MRISAASCSRSGPRRGLEADEDRLALKLYRHLLAGRGEAEPKAPCGTDRELGIPSPTEVPSKRRIVATAAALAGAPPADAREDAVTGWPLVGSDQAHTTYSTAGAITAARVTEPEIAWTWERGETPLPECGTRPSPF